MKKLTVVPLVLLGLSSFAQSTDGLSKEHMIPAGAGQETEGARYTPKRIALKTGVEVEYVEQGKPDGVPVIFLHGITDSWHSFETVLPLLPERIHAFALSQRGHGDSDRPTDKYSPGHFAADVAAFIQEKQLGKVTIVGHSMGGLIAQQFVLHYPHLTTALVVVSSDPAIRKNTGMPEFFQEVMQMKDNPDREFMTAFQKGVLAKDIDSVYFNLLIDESLKVPISVFQQAFRGLIDADYTNQLKKVTQPTLIFWGNKDAFFLREGQETLVKNIRGSKWIVYEDVGHSVHWEEPQRFAKDLVDFIDEDVIRKNELKKSIE